MTHMYLHAPKGEAKATKLSEKQAREIKQRRADARRYKKWADGLTKSKLAEKFEVNKSTIERIVNNRRWVEGQPPPKNVKGFSMDDARLIRECWRQKEEWLKKWRESSGPNLAKEYGVCEDMVYAIERGDKWKYIDLQNTK